MTDTCRIIPLGGLGEVGKNMTVFEVGDDLVIVDAGLAFPRDEHLGVDLVLPDLTYLRERKGRIRAVILTHAHEDHVGGLPYLLREIDVDEIWATRLTLGLVKSKLDEHGLLRAAELREVHPDDEPAELGPFKAGVRPHGALDPRLRRDRAARPRPGRSCTRATTRSTTRPVDGLRTDVGKLASSGTAASTCCSATRRTRSAPA